MPPPRLIAGLMGSSVQAGSNNLATTEQLTSFLALLAKSRHKVTQLDTARVYNNGKSEEDIGSLSRETKAPFTIATKAPGFSPGSLSYDRVVDNCNKSLKALRQDAIDLYYFHGPDRQTPIEESCRAIHDLHSAGKIRAFGVSNYSRDEVVLVHSTCKSRGWILPTVYQGGYSPIARAAETELFPTLRELGMVFYAYSPLAAGFFSKTTQQLREAPAKGGRFDMMKVVKDMFINEKSVSLHEILAAACDKESIPMKQATLRFLAYHSKLNEKDGMILGASSESQMEENLAAVEGGPLPQSLVDAFESLWRDYDGHGASRMYCV